MKTQWKHAMLAEILFLTIEDKRTAVGMIQPNGTRFQAMIIFPDVRDPELKCLGFYETAEIAKRVVEMETRNAFSELRATDPEACVVREYEREAVNA
jgi:hypothetical protein